MNWAQTLASSLTGTGLFARGGFHPAPEDAVPALPDGRAAATVVLVGNAGRALWDALKRDNPDLAGEHPLDRWVEAKLDAAGRALGAAVIHATRKPWPPIQRWALRADAVHRSPIGLLIHRDYGLWHVYRGALLFAERLDLPPRAAPGPSPCETCTDKPCLSTCPVDAFTPGRFDPIACVDHMESAAGKACAYSGCLARRACPVGRGFGYPPEAGAFHMRAVTRTVRTLAARGELKAAALPE